MTPKEFKAQLRARGQTASGWAAAHGFPKDLVYRVLNGRTPAWRGKTHDIAVAMGLKSEDDFAIVTEPVTFKPETGVAASSATEKGAA